MTAALIAFVLAQLADVLTTIRALDRGGVEANPAVRWMMDRFGKGWVVFKLAVAGGAAAMIYASGHVWAMWGMAALIGLIALRNTRVAR